MLPPMRRYALISLAMCAVLLAAGCVSMTPEECLHADWRAVGHEDGAAGRGAATLGDHREACAEVGVTPDFNAYQAGWREGVRLFCHPANAYRLGRGGYTYTGICPADLEPGFLDALDEGLFVYGLEAAVDEVAREIGRVDYAIAENEEDIAEAEERLEQGDLSDEERRRLRQHVRSLDREIGRLEADRRALLVELRVREARLQDHLGGI